MLLVNFLYHKRLYDMHGHVSIFSELKCWYKSSFVISLKKMIHNRHMYFVKKTKGLYVMVLDRKRLKGLDNYAAEGAKGIDDSVCRNPHFFFKIAESAPVLSNKS